MKTEIKKRDGIPVQQVAYINDLKVTTAGSYVAANDTFGTAIGKLDTAIANIPAQTNYAVTCAETTPEGYAKTYTFTQCGQTIATVNIPKDMVVSSGQIVVNPAGQPAGTYIELTLANAGSSKIYINVADLIDVYTAEQNATQVQLAISNTNEISATIVAGSITATELASNAVTTAKILDANVTKAKLDAEVQASLALADSALQQHQDISGKADKSEMTVTPGTGTDADKTTIQLKSGTSATVLTAHQDISGKADASDLTAHTGNTDIHVTTADKTAWNGAVSDLATHTADTTVHITAAERTAWDAKYDLPSGGITTADLSSGVVASLGKADTALQASNLDGTTIEKDATAGVRVVAGSITSTHLDTGVNASLAKADTALQASDITGKADKVANATSGNFAGLDANGNLTDSGFKPADFQTAGSYKTTQTAKTDPTASGNAVAFIASIEQNANGEVTATKSTVSVDNSTIVIGDGALRVTGGGITSYELAESSVQTAKIVNGAVTTDKLATLTSFKLVDTANDGSAYQGQVYQITIDHGAIMVTPVAS